MSIRKEKILLTNNNVNIKFSLSQNNQFTGLKQEIDKLTRFNSLDVVNPVVDGEKTRFRFNSTSSGTIKFEFYNDLTSNYINSLIPAGFLIPEIRRRNLNVQNSFFIMDYYDSFDTYSQNKIFSTYLTKIVFGEEVIDLIMLNFDLFDRRVQFNTLNIPNWYLESHTGNTITGYSKFYFYNAKTGRTIPFFNLDNTNLKTPERQYFKTELFKGSRLWRIVTPSMPSITAREIREINNPLFVEKVNNTVNNFENIRLNFPDGRTFNDETGTYFTT